MRKSPFQRELLSLSRRLDTTCTSVSLCLHRFIGVGLTPLFHDRNPDLWGSDAREFRPERWFQMNEQVESPVGMYGNLYSHAPVLVVSLGIDFLSIQLNILRRCQGLSGVAIRVR